MSPTTVLTGFPATFLARHVLAELLSAASAARFTCLVPPDRIEHAKTVLANFPSEDRGRVEVLEGDITAIDFGLSGRAYTDLAARTEVIHHCAATTSVESERRVAERLNIGGTSEAAELAETAAGLRRFVVWSTAAVSGEREGRVLESDFDAPPAFRTIVEETRFRAERIARAAKAPTVILRPSFVIGHSRSGDMDPHDGFYLLILLMLNAPADRPLTIPTRKDAALPIVPVDFAASAGRVIAEDDRAIGKTFHLVDPHPLSAGRVFDLLAHAVGKPLADSPVPARLADALLRAPGFDRFSKAPRAFLHHIAANVAYDTRNADALLAGRGIECPGFETYVARLVERVRNQKNEVASSRSEHEHDPLG